jgi:hypothetical protein
MVIAISTWGAAGLAIIASAAGVHVVCSTLRLITVVRQLREAGQASMAALFIIFYPIWLLFDLMVILLKVASRIFGSGLVPRDISACPRCEQNTLECINAVSDGAHLRRYYRCTSCGVALRRIGQGEFTDVPTAEEGLVLPELRKRSRHRNG